MEKSFHRFTELFKQLGLASDPREIEDCDFFLVC